MKLALFTLLAPLVVATVSLEELVCGINKARAEMQLPTLYTGPIITEVAQANADGNVPNFPAQQALDDIKKKRYIVTNLGVAMVAGCKETEICLRLFTEKHGKYTFGKYTAIGLVQSGEWYTAMFINGKGADLIPGVCGTDSLEPPNKADVEGGEIGKIDPNILLCLINKERAKDSLPILGYYDAVSRVAAESLKNEKLKIFDALEKEKVEDAATMSIFYGSGCTSEKQCLDFFLNGDLRDVILKADVNVAGFAITEDKQNLAMLFVGTKSIRAAPPTQC